MAWETWGRSTSITSAPAERRASIAERKAAMIPSSTPAARNLQGTPTRRPRALPSRPEAKRGTSIRALVASIGSHPHSTSAIRATSSTLRAKGPIWSRDEAKATRP